METRECFTIWKEYANNKTNIGAIEIIDEDEASYREREIWKKQLPSKLGRLHRNHTIRK